MGIMTFLNIESNKEESEFRNKSTAIKVAKNACEVLYLIKGLF